MDFTHTSSSSDRIIGSINTPKNSLIQTQTYPSSNPIWKHNPAWPLAAAGLGGQCDQQLYLSKSPTSIPTTWESRVQLWVRLDEISWGDSDGLDAFCCYSVMSPTWTCDGGPPWSTHKNTLPSLVCAHTWACERFSRLPWSVYSFCLSASCWCL